MLIGVERERDKGRLSVLGGYHVTLHILYSIRIFQKGFVSRRIISLALHPSLNSFIIPFSKELKKPPFNGENVIKTELPQTRHNKHKNSSRIQLTFFKIFTLDVIPFPFKGSLNRGLNFSRIWVFGRSVITMIDKYNGFCYGQNLISVWVGRVAANSRRLFQLIESLMQLVRPID